MRKFANRIWGSLFKILGFLCLGFVLFLLLVMMYHDFAFFDYVETEVLIAIFAGLGFYILDFIITKFIKNKRHLLITQSILLLFIAAGSWLYYLKTLAYTTIILTHKNRQEAAIIFGIKGYPPLPESNWWKITIKIPENGVLMTSSTLDDLKNYPIRIIQNNWIVDQKIQTFYHPCIVTNNQLEVQYLSGEKCKCNYVSIPRSNTRIQNHCYAVYDSLALGLLTSKVKDKYYKKVVFRDSGGLYFDSRLLPNNWKGPLPDCVSQFNWYKAIFSKSSIHVIPPGIVRNPNITELYFSDTRLSTIDSTISLMTNLRLLDVSGTPMDQWPESISQLKQLKILNITNTPNIKTQLKYLKRLLPNTTFIYN